MSEFRKFFLALAIAVGAPLALGVCDPGGDEPGSAVLPLGATGDGLEECVNDLGWTVSVDAFRLVVRDLELTIEGETHEALLQRVSKILVHTAMAHPGHYAGGEVTGELPGRFALDLVAGEVQELGDATLLAGEYHGFNLYFARAEEADGIGADDPLLGHTAVIEGTATSGAEEIEFTATLDIEEGTQMVGGVFEMDVSESSTGELVMEVLTIDPTEGDTLFDGIDFGALDEDDDGVVEILPGEESHNVLMKTLQVHDHYEMEVRQ